MQTKIKNKLLKWRRRRRRNKYNRHYKKK